MFPIKAFGWQCFDSKSNHLPVKVVELEVIIYSTGRRGDIEGFTMDTYNGYYITNYITNFF